MGEGRWHGGYGATGTKNAEAEATTVAAMVYCKMAKRGISGRRERMMM
jgi:hypothetical protein